MNLTLIHKEFRPDGVFGILQDDQGNIMAHTLEHSYDDGNGGWTQKLQPGTYTCQRGPHKLNSTPNPFITFMVLDVPDFQGNPVTGLLLHWGNFDKDSEGCVLLGATEVWDGTEEMVTNSKATWEKFMQLEDGQDTFTLTVS